MANEATSAASVQCPVCFKDFTSASINGHLDVCLNDPDNLSAAEECGPRGKKPRMCAAPAESPRSAAVFSVFQANRGRAARDDHEQNGSCSGKQTVSKGIKRSLLGEKDAVEPEKSQLTLNAAEAERSQPPVNAAADLPIKPLSEMLVKPLAETLRPKSLLEYFGQSKVVGEQTLLRTLLESQEIPSLILWGPPGCGKTTLAQIIAANSKKNGTARFVTMSATSASTAEVRDVIKQAQNELRLCRRKTILFIDEIHRFNKSQQDTLSGLTSSLSNRLIHPKCLRERYRKSFLPTAVRLYNKYSSQ